MILRRAACMLGLGAALRVCLFWLPTAPTPVEVPKGASSLEILDRVLVDHAVALGWHRTDPAVRRRLIEDLRFWGRGGDDASLVDEGIALGLHRADPIILQRLAWRGEQALLREDRVPSDDELDAWRLAHPERFRRPETLRLRLAPSPVFGPEVSGSSDRLDRLLGRGFSASTSDLEVGATRGIGDLRVTMKARVPGVLPTLSTIRSEVAADLARSRQATLRAERVAALLAATPIVEVSP